MDDPYGEFMVEERPHRAYFDDAYWEKRFQTRVRGPHKPLFAGDRHFESAFSAIQSSCIESALKTIQSKQLCGSSRSPKVWPDAYAPLWSVGTTELLSRILIHR